MKTEAGSNNIINNNNTTSNNNNNSKMEFVMYPSISGKQQDPVREVVMKYIDYFLPESDASGTSAVAIDNKIEQAMDLVKSHLMIAVREEVEVLKERISELMDKISNLELENNILKSNMSPETLQQLQMQLQIAGSQQPAAVAAPPATPAIQAAPTAATVTAAAAATSTAAATSPATSAAPATILANGSAENGGSSVVVDAAVSVVDAVQQQQAATNGSSGVAPAVVSTNGPMS